MSDESKQLAVPSVRRKWLAWSIRLAEMVKGQSIDVTAVKRLLSGAAIVIAHNARFDRPFCEGLLDEFKDISWACSIADVSVARLLAEAGLQVIANPHAPNGMGTSIACGVAASPNADGWVIALADMPNIPANVIQSVADGLTCGADIIAPVYRGQRGHPVGFALRHASALRALHSDRGARDIIAAHRSTLELIDTQDSAVILDIDTPASLPVHPPGH